MAPARKMVSPGILILERQVTLRLHPAVSFLSDGSLAELDGGLRQILPRWTSKLRVGVELGKRASIDASKPGSLTSAIKRHIRPGKHYKAAARALGPAKYERDTGFAMLGGAYRGVEVAVFVDEWLFAPKPDGQQWGNRLSITVQTDTVEDMPTAQWLRAACGTLCRSMEFAHGYACCDLEYYAKNMQTGSTVQAIGLDPTRYLPGLYWLNLFGKPYVTLIGASRLLATPGAETSKLGSHVLVVMGSDPYQWKSKLQISALKGALNHIGPQFFFDRRQRRCETSAPRFRVESDRKSTPARG